MARGVISGIKNRWWKAWGVSGGGVYISTVGGFKAPMTLQFERTGE